MMHTALLPLLHAAAVLSAARGARAAPRQQAEQQQRLPQRVTPWQDVLQGDREHADGGGEE